MELNKIGLPLYWHLADHIRAIEGMIRADELQIALEMCDRVPGYYRDNYPPELAEIKRKIYERTYDQIEYASDDEEANCTREFGEEQWTNGYMVPRAQVMAELVREINARPKCVDEIKTPWIFDLGCSHGNLPLGLMKEKFKFTYLGRGMNWRIQEKVKGWVGDHWAERPTTKQTTILYCTEVIEHCFNPHDIVHSAYKVGVNWDYIVLSVPKYTLGGGLENWNRRLGHVRTWTPNEFIQFADKAWPGYAWTLYDSHSMVLKGQRK